MAAGACRRLAFEIPAGRLGFTGADGRFVVEPGEVTFLVGASYDDVRASTTAVLTGPPAFPDRNAVPPFSVTVPPQELP